MTQWRVVVSDMTGVRYQGIDYAAMPPVLAMLGVRQGRWAEVFRGVQTMERAALPLLNTREAN